MEEKKPANLKVEKFKMAVKEQYQEVKTWIIENKEVAYGMGAAIISGIFGIGSELIRASATKESTHVAYDDGVSLNTKRKLSRKDYRKFKELKQDGYSTGEALDSMGLLK